MKEPLQKLAYIWLIFIVIVFSFLVIYFFKPSRCESTTFECTKLYINGNHISLKLINNYHPVRLINVSAPCLIEKWTFDGQNEEMVFELNEEVNMDISCFARFDDLDIILDYTDINSNVTRSDVISIKR
jgi:hypothetical protein